MTAKQKVIENQRLKKEIPKSMWCRIEYEFKQKDMNMGQIEEWFDKFIDLKHSAFYDRKRNPENLTIGQLIIISCFIGKPLEYIIGG